MSSALYCFLRDSVGEPEDVTRITAAPARLRAAMSKPQGRRS